MITTDSNSSSENSDLAWTYHNQNQIIKLKTFSTPLCVNFVAHVILANIRPPLPYFSEDCKPTEFHPHLTEH